MLQRITVVAFLCIALGGAPAHAFFNLFPGNGGASASSTANGADSLSTSVRGVAPSDANQYAAMDFICDGGKRTLPKSSINDGFCDCDDGTDEPGTSACNNGKFRCVNKGYKVVTIPSSRVDDGICDCCDGSDEMLLSRVKCPNTCDVHASAQRATMEKIVTMYRTGSSIRMRYIDEAGRAFADATNALSVVGTEESLLLQQKVTQETIVAHEEVLEQAERADAARALNADISAALGLERLRSQPEHLGQVLRVLIELFDIQPFALDKLLFNVPLEGGGAGQEEGESHSEVGLDGTGAEAEAETDAGAENPLAWVSQLSPQEQAVCHLLSQSLTDRRILPLCKHASGTTLKDTPGSPLVAAGGELLKEIISDRVAYKEVQYALLGVLTGVGYRVQSTLRQQLESQGMHPEGESPNAPPVVPVQEVDPDAEPVFQTASVVQYVKNRKDYSLEQCLAEFPSEQNLCAMGSVLEGLFAKGYGSRFTYTRADTDSARGVLRDIESKLSDLNSRKATSEKAIKLYNEHNAHLPYLALKAQQSCFEVGDGNFIYNMCLFDSVSQKERHGSSRTVTLGTFKSFSENDATGGVTMHFDGGTHCHAHGARKADVTVTCGISNILKEPREPSTCFYTLEFETPAACTEKFAEANGIVNAMSNLS